MPIIEEKIKDPADIKLLSNEDVLLLESEIRKEIIAVVSQNGGHLASNLGVIELTIALLRQFDFTKDRIVWDVGHQTYAYKILTGRHADFCTLRRMSGLSGFPKRCESGYDCFNTGHSSTSISAALGILRANKIKGDNHKVIAVIGDGALTGGMAFEALNDAGQSNLDLLVILNDNQMSISRNVGGMSKHLENIRVSKQYIGFKNKTIKLLSRSAAGNLLKKPLERIKDLLKFIVKPSKVIFENLGFKYYGPVDGHDIHELEMHFEAIKNISGPVLMHVHTRKGKGYEFAEISPDKYHGVAPFEIANGLPASCHAASDGFRSFSDAFAAALIDLAEHDSEITAVSAAMTSGTGLDRFAKIYPDRFFDVGIAEQHALTMAAGMACVGIKPVVAIYSTFLQRAYDQLLHDIALQNLHVVVCIDRAGIVGEDGETHQGIYDLSILTGIPGLTILSPRDYIELRAMLGYAIYRCTGPVAIRYPRGCENSRTAIYREKDSDIAGGGTLVGHSSGLDHFADSYLPMPVLLETGEDITLISEGIMFAETTKAAELLKVHGYSCDIIDVRRIKPLDPALIVASVKKTGRVIIAENAISVNGLGSMVEALLFSNNINIPLFKVGVGDHPLCQGKIAELFRSEGMDADSIMLKAKEMIENS
ncbi:MAG: 1-deoxy-D-xylulose-5-phosphate synthase [Saccharofermentanales bacterium]